jgi:cadmium resistance protein CadD (predicted permease)
VYEVPVIIGVAVAAFVSTNLDNLFLLMGIMSGAGLRTRDVALGYGCAMALVLTAGLAGSYAADLTTQSWLRYLGLIPLTMGLSRVRAMVRPAIATAGNLPARSGVASIFWLMVANSSDSLGVFLPLMGETSELLVVVIAATALAMTTIWAITASWLVEHPTLAPRLRAVDRYLVPAMLVAIGLYILTDTATDTV